MTAEALDPTEVADWGLRRGLEPTEVPAMLHGSSGLIEFGRRLPFGRIRCADAASFEGVLWSRQLSTMTVFTGTHTSVVLELGERSPNDVEGSVVAVSFDAATVTEDADGSTQCHEPDELILFTPGAPGRIIAGEGADVAGIRMSLADVDAAGTLLHGCGGLAAMDSLLARTAGRCVRGFGASVMSDQTHDSSLPAELAVSNLLSAAAAEAAAQRTSTSGNTRYVQRETRGLIERHYRDPDFSPTMIADRLHLSRRQFYRHFENSDRGVAELIADRRLEAARTLLVSNPAASISSVARACGFGSLGPFRLRFRRKFGMGPNEFRDQVTAGGL